MVTVPSVGDVRGMREEGGGRREVYTPSTVRATNHQVWTTKVNKLLELWELI